MLKMYKELLEKTKLKNIVYDEDKSKCCSQKEWDYLIKSLHIKNLKQEIHKSVYFYFLEVLPPIKMFWGGFLFREGMDENTLKFTEENGKFYCECIKSSDVIKEVSE